MDDFRSGLGYGFIVGIVFMLAACTMTKTPPEPCVCKCELPEKKATDTHCFFAVPNGRDALAKPPYEFCVEGWWREYEK